MAETSDDPGPGAHEEAGSVGEEAAKLFSVLSGWARDTGVVSADRGSVRNRRRRSRSTRTLLTVSSTPGS